MRVLPPVLQRGKKVGSATGPEELIILNHGSDTDTRGRKRILNPDYTRQETYANGIGEGDMRRKRQSDFKLGSGVHRFVEVEENAAGANVLGFCMKLVGAFEFDDRGQAHVETPHCPPFL